MSVHWSFFVASLARPRASADEERALLLAFGRLVPGVRLLDLVDGELVELVGHADAPSIRPASAQEIAHVRAGLIEAGMHLADGVRLSGRTGCIVPRHWDPFPDVGDVLVPGLGRERLDVDLPTPWLESGARSVGDLDVALAGLEEEIEEGRTDEDEEAVDLEEMDELARGLRVARRLGVAVVCP